MDKYNMMAIFVMIAIIFFATKCNKKEASLHHKQGTTYHLKQVGNTSIDGNVEYIFKIIKD